MAGRVRWLLILMIAAGLASAAAWWGWREYHAFETRPLAQPGAVLVLERGQGLKQLVGQLRTAGHSDAPEFFWRLLAERMGASARLQAGEFRIDANMTPRALLQAIVDGRVVQYRFTIIEGWRFAELRVALAADPVLESTLGGLDDAEVLRRIGASETHAEGRFLPDTYFFPRGFQDVDLLQRAYWAQKKVLEQAWQARAEDLPLANAEEALILASLIEKETGRAEERPTIGGVFVNRLRIGMRLQTDPTVIYGMGAAFDGNLRRRDLETDTPYNTYTRFGLPPTPIAMPGRDAILAATQPARTEAYYFVAKGDGTHQFSRTLDEHNRAVRRYQLRQG